MKLILTIFLTLFCLWNSQLRAQHSDAEKNSYKKSDFAFLACVSVYHSQYHSNQFSGIRQLQSHVPGIQGGLAIYHCENQKSGMHSLSIDYAPSIIKGTQTLSYEQAQNTYTCSMGTSVSSFGILYEYRKGYRMSNWFEAYGLLGIGVRSDSVFQELNILSANTNNPGLGKPTNEFHDTYNYRRTMYPASIGMGITLFNTTQLFSVDLGVKYSYPVFAQPTIKYIDFESIEYQNNNLTYSFRETTMNHWMYYLTLRISFFKHWSFG